MKTKTKVMIIIGVAMIIVLSILGTMMYLTETGSGPEKVIWSISDLGIDNYNAQFLNYIGKKIRGSNAYSLVVKIKFNNIENTDNIISVDYNPIVGNPITSVYDEEMLQKIADDFIVRSVHYIVEISQYTNEGAISKITITEIDSEYNKKFEIYEGKYIVANSVRNLIDTVRTNNILNVYNIVEIEYKSLSGDEIIKTSNDEALKKIEDEFIRDNSYEIRITEYTEEGQVSTIAIFENSK